MQFAGKKPPPAIIVLFVTFFPLQGFFNLVVYKFPQINRYFEKKKGGSLSSSISAGGSITSFLSSIRRNRMERAERKKGKDKVDARLTSVTLESENRTSTIVKESEAPADDEHDVEDIAGAGKSTVTFAPEVELKEYALSLGEETSDHNHVEGGWEDENDAASNSRDEADAIDELANIVEA